MDISAQPAASFQIRPNFDYFRVSPDMFPGTPVLVKKTCSKCGEAKGLDKFYTDVGVYGRRASCIKCSSAKGTDGYFNQLGSPRMGYKFCAKCGEEKPTDRFSKHICHSDGLASVCKACSKKACAVWHTAKMGARTHKDCCRCGDKYPLADFAVGGIKLHKICARCRTELQSSPKQCLACNVIKPREDFAKNGDTVDGLLPRCILCHRQWTLAKAKAKYNSDPVNRLVRSLRSRLWDAVNRGSKVAHTLTLVGCSGAKLMDHLESLFWPGMTRTNQGRKGWVVDHIVPIESFNKSDPDWQFKSFHYTNLQPLWFSDNASKQDRLDWSPEESQYELPERLKMVDK